jgi:hypothetical protein
MEGGPLNQEILEIIKAFEERMKKIHPLPWEFSGNIPFDVQVRKPRESLSKHTDTNPCSWHYDDGCYVAMAVNHVPKLIEEIKRLNDILYNVGKG